jgi:hypothetical protein
LGKTGGATGSHEYSELGEHTTTLHAWDVPEGNTGLGEFPTFSGDIRRYIKQTESATEDNDWLVFETNAEAWASFASQPWVLFDTVPNTESGIQSCGYNVRMRPGFTIGVAPGPFIERPDHYWYQAIKIERDINLSQAETGKIIIIPNGVAVAFTHLLSALGYDFPARYGGIFNKSTGEQIGSSGHSDFANKQPYGDWSDMAREDIVVEYKDAENWAVLKDPADYGGTFNNQTHGWSMEARGFSLADDGIYYKSYTCRKKRSGGTVIVT